MAMFRGAVFNEFVKLKGRLMVLVCLFTAMLIGLVILQETARPENTPTPSDWTVPHLETLERIKMASLEAKGEERVLLERKAHFMELQLQAQTNPEAGGAIHWVSMELHGGFLRYALPLLMLFLGSDLFSKEFASKTIKSPLLSPIGRTKLAIGKWTALWLMAQFFLFIYIAVVFGIGLADGGWNEGASSQVIVYGANQSAVIPIHLFILIALAGQMIVTAACASIILLVSYLLRHSVSMSVVISVAVLFVAEFMLSGYSNRIPLLSMFPTRHFAFLDHLTADWKHASGSFFESLLILTATYAVCLTLLLVLFRKQDVHA
ncbi:ABC transporter permease subunit [Paenibacillus albicereus]|uniref:ABC transporter permease subunit n=1 Tax=Paenibacillus albicereus TaxID=2726185 RepID=A0A6H2H1J1_9BACL|nr:ABC transporter permease [Paenibacillus albicereus]QJC53286.1 ABC transporter permease subunit [Paenibacillus albicereus]